MSINHHADPSIAVAPLASGHWLPWQRYNLWRNPFGELTRSERSKLAVIDLNPLLAALQRTGGKVDHAAEGEAVGQHRAIQLIGRCGRGKTTRLLALAAQLPDAAYVYLDEQGPCPAIPHGAPLMIDEAQRLPAAARRQIFASGVTLVLATHRDLSWSLRRHGYRVHTWRIGRDNTAAMVHELCNRRIEASRLGSGRVPQMTLSDAHWLVRRFGSDVRAIESYLYERLQNQLADDGEMRFID